MNALERLGETLNFIIEENLTLSHIFAILI
jgi:hypothetical protein